MDIWLPFQLNNPNTNKANNYQNNDKEKRYILENKFIIKLNK